MSGFKGTTGPWLWVKEVLCNEVFIVGGQEHKFNQHNKALIAAAPDLLEALHQITDEYIRTRCQLNDDDAEEMETVTCVIAARKAIKKALGE